MPAQTYKHPKTGEEKTISEWAEEIGIAHSTLWLRIQRHPLEVALKKGNLAPGRAMELFTCPTTGVTLNAYRWAEKLKISSETFRVRVKNWGPDNPKTYKSEGFYQSESLAHQLAAKRGALFCVNPVTKEKHLPSELAEKYNISMAEMYRLMKEYKPNSIEFFRVLKESHEINNRAAV